jgi:hypothetical protein
VDYRIRVPNTKLPDRAELGDLDEAQWELSPDGKSRKDPWQNTRFVYLIDPITNEAFTFTTSSWGGRNAVIDLADQIVRTRRVRPGVVPLVELSAASHTTKFGRKSKPHFKVVEWRGGTREEGPQPQIDNDPQPQIECVTPEGVINDQIPWRGRGQRPTICNSKRGLYRACLCSASGNTRHAGLSVSRRQTAGVSTRL